jgi:deoxycytidylate deaminase
MPVNIHGKDYKTVAERVNEFRTTEKYADYAIHTEIINAGDLVQMKALILDENFRVIATGFAEEVRGSTNINKTSALENCETSAIGRALSALGLGGSQYASADEVANAIAQQAQQEVAEAFIAHNHAVFAHIGSLEAIRAAIIQNDLSTAHECWSELGRDVQTILWRAPSKGGFFSTKEREIMKSTEWREAGTYEPE